MRQIVAGLFFLGLGCALFFAREKFAREVVHFQNTVWGFHFGERELRASVIIAVLVGIVFIYGGISLLMKAMAAR